MSTETDERVSHVGLRRKLAYDSAHPAAVDLLYGFECCWPNESASVLSKVRELSMRIMENIREVVDVVQKLDNADLYRRVLDLQAEILSLTSTLQERENRITDLESHLNPGGQLVRDREVYWDQDDRGKPTGDPYCSYCWESARLAIHLIERSCPHCKTLHTSLPSHY